MATTLKPFRMGAVAAVIIGVALVAWLVLGGADEGGRANEHQVEVYDPSPDRPLELVTSGAIQPVR
jgi:hypothetical protein